MVHQYKNNGYNIVLDVNSGAIHVVDDVTYDVIELFEDNSAKEIIIAVVLVLMKDVYKRQGLCRAGMQSGTLIRKIRRLKSLTSILNHFMSMKKHRRLSLIHI